MKGYKVFNPDWTCRGFQFEVGKTFEEDVKPDCCSRGFHFCIKASDCFNFYRFDPNNKVAEVEALGDINTHSGGDKCSTNKLHIIREVSWQEVLELVNSGKACTGHHNTGNRNSGDWNSGDSNSGCRNSGDWNSGDWNSGDWNSGGWNSGNRNSGDSNSGHRNSGNCNSGNLNSGNCNSGNSNSGDSNSGDSNTGNRNSGNCNSGDWNSGNWNKASQTLGCFNTESQKLKFFDKETNLTMNQWWNSDARSLLSRIDFGRAEWIWTDDMTDEEKAEHPEHKTTGGCLRLRDYTDLCAEWWKDLTEEEKQTIKDIPNFDAEKFKLITGIEV